MAIQSDASAQEATTQPGGAIHALTSRAERLASTLFVAPAVLVVLFLSLFPLVISLYLSLSRFQLVQGGFSIKFIGLLNYRKLLFGSERDHFLGVFARPTLLAWLLLALVGALLIVGLARYVRGPDIAIMGLFWRIVGALSPRFGAAQDKNRTNDVANRSSRPGAHGDYPPATEYT